jgi:hypothetical protein
MYLKLHKSEKGTIVAVCDKELIGNVIEEGKKVLDLQKYKNFYVGRIATEKEIAAALKNCHSASLVGKKAVSVAVKMGMIKEDDIMYIKGFPYIQIYKI